MQRNDETIRVVISTEEIELHITMTEAESYALIADIETADWDKRTSIKAGTCLSHPIFWCTNKDKSLSMLIGQDDETWQVGLSLSMEIIKELKSFIKFNIE